MTHDIQVCLVSAQTTPNFLPLLDERTRAARVALVVSPPMAQRADWLESAMRPRGVQVERILVDDVYDFFGMQERLLDWLSAQGQAEVALNVTGGTKLMAMAAQAVFQAAGQPIFYLNERSHEVIWLGEVRNVHKLAARMRLREYLQIHGYSADYDKPPVQAALRDLAETLVLNARRWGGSLGLLNALAQGAKKGLRSAPVPAAFRSRAEFQELLDVFEPEGLLCREGDVLVFASEQARSFVNGGWFELHVYRVLADLAPELQLTDYACNLKVQAPDGKTRNELDAAFMHDNRLFLIECKTANLSPLTDSGDSKATGTIYKLDALMDIGGHGTRGMLVDFRGGLSREDLERARLQRIQVVSAAGLVRLKDQLREWVTEGASVSR